MQQDRKIHLTYFEYNLQYINCMVFHNLQVSYSQLKATLY